MTTTIDYSHHWQLLKMGKFQRYRYYVCVGCVARRLILHWEDRDYLITDDSIAPYDERSHRCFFKEFRMHP